MNGALQWTVVHQEPLVITENLGRAAEAAPGA
jgi:hypothetical protein